MKVLITGVNGQLGSELYATLNYENYGLDLSIEKNNTNLFTADLVDKDTILTIFKKIKPDLVIHCGAISSPDACENNMENAWKTNVIGTKNIVDACSKFGSKLIFISTNYIFDGKKGYYKEYDLANPINFYGKTKLIGEWLTKTLKESTIIRTSSLLSNKPRSLFDWVVNSLAKGEITAAVDLIESPTLVSELTEAINETIKKNLTGVYHMAGDERISRYDFMKKIAASSNYNENLVKPINSEELKFKSPRPKETSLDISKVKKIGINFSKLDDAIEKLIYQRR